MMNLVKKDRPKGQVMMIVLVISTLTLMLLLGVASRIDISRTSIRRSSEFDRAVAASDNALNQIIKVIENGSCSLAFDSVDYKQLTGCAALTALDDTVQVFGKESADKKISVSAKSPIALFLGDTSGNKVASTGVRVVCETADANFKFIVSRVYQDTDTSSPTYGSYKVDKGITTCKAANDLATAARGNVNLYGTYMSGGTQITGLVSRPEPAGSAILYPRGDTKLVRVRPVDSSGNATNKISIELINSSNGNNQVMASTGKFDFIVVGAGGLGSEVAIKFQKQRGDYTYVPSAFDFVYFGDETQ